jgi:hypothetical protein
MPRILFALALFLLIPPVGHAQAPAHAGTSVPRNRAAEFLEQLQRALDTGDRPAVARMVRYPATALAAGWNIPVKNSSALLAMYDALFTPELRCAIVQSGIARTDAPAPKHVVVVSPEGLVIGGGAVWAPLKDAQYKIARLMVPPAVPSPSPRIRPERVSFLAPTGERNARFAGWLLRHNVDTYLVAAKKGESLQASIEGFRGHDATLRVTTGPPLDGLAKDAGRTWTGIASADGDYRIEVIHLAPYCDPAQQYKLAITLR